MEWGFTWRVGHKLVPVPLNDVGWGIIWVELHVEDDQFFMVLVGGTSVGSGSGDGFLEKGKHLASLVATLDQSVVEFPCL